MNEFALVGIVIAVIIIIILIVVVVLFATNNSSNSDNCQTDSDCPNNEICQEVNGQNQCVSAPSVNAASDTCQSDADCANGMTCSSTIRGGPKTCRPQMSITSQKNIWRRRTNKLQPANDSGYASGPSILDVDIPELDIPELDISKSSTPELAISQSSIPELAISTNPINEQKKEILELGISPSHKQEPFEFRPSQTQLVLSEHSITPLSDDEEPSFSLSNEEKEPPSIEYVEKSVRPHSPILMSPHQTSYKLPETGPAMYSLSVSSLTNSSNSSGEYSDQPFGVISESTESEHSRAPSPVIEPVGQPSYPHVLKVAGNSPVHDACSYSRIVVYLLENGDIIHENGDERRQVQNNIHLQQIASFHGYLHGLGKDGFLYRLPNECLSRQTWKWTKCSWTPGNIRYISATYDSSCLWIEYQTHGVLFQGTSLQYQLAHSGIRRIMGKDKNHYIDLNLSTHTAELHPSNNRIDNVWDAALSYYDEVITIDLNDRSRYRKVAIVQWTPYLIPY